ncbi:MAG: hypothetical protein IPK98_03620 [Chloracidobacterium sp.]|nr:hypothetical protein [Chloracidobacterium sp.]
MTMFSTAFFGILGAPEELIGIIAITGVFGAMMIIIASLIFLPSSKVPVLLPQFQPPQQPAMYGASGQYALPPQQSIPANMYNAPRPAGSWRDTNDLEPTSVTESTTRLLEKDEKII